MFACAVKRRTAGLFNFFYFDFICNRNDFTRYKAVTYIFTLEKFIEPLLKNIDTIVSG